MELSIRSGGGGPAVLPGADAGAYVHGYSQSEGLELDLHCLATAQEAQVPRQCALHRRVGGVVLQVGGIRRKHAVRKNAWTTGSVPARARDTCRYYGTLLLLAVHIVLFAGCCPWVGKQPLWTPSKRDQSSEGTCAMCIRVLSLCLAHAVHMGHAKYCQCVRAHVSTPSRPLPFCTYMPRGVPSPRSRMP